MGHGAHRRRYRCRHRRGGRSALPSDSSSDSNDDDDSGGGDDAVDRLIRASSWNATDENEEGRTKSSEVLLGTTAILSSAWRHANKVSGEGCFTRNSPKASATTTTKAVAEEAASKAAATAAVESFEQATLKVAGAGQGWFWGAPS